MLVFIRISRSDYKLDIFFHFEYVSSKIMTVVSATIFLTMEIFKWNLLTFKFSNIIEVYTEVSIQNCFCESERFIGKIGRLNYKMFVTKTFKMKIKWAKKWIKK